MSEQKAAKLLAKALNNPSREEATTAFGMAWAMALRAGVALSSLHVIREEAAGISEERERELVDKYNRLLVEARQLRSERDYYRRLWNESEGEAEKKLERLKKYVKRL
ncbi:TPA: hypothetical protein QH074_004297 [Enterobacter hormaechei subsp. steigerwaltii]|nr:hypothetical protein [Enterobacter hormaechei subsp. steigerwaltii]